MPVEMLTLIVAGDEVESTPTDEAVVELIAVELDEDTSRPSCLTTYVAQPAVVATQSPMIGWLPSAFKIYLQYPVVTLDPLAPP